MIDNMKRTITIALTVIVLVLFALGVWWFYYQTPRDTRNFIENEKWMSNQYSGRAAQIMEQCRNSRNARRNRYDTMFITGGIEFMFKEGISKTAMEDYFVENNFPQDKLVTATDFGMGSIRVQPGTEQCWIRELEKHPELKTVFQTPEQTLN